MHACLHIILYHVDYCTKLCHISGTLMMQGQFVYEWFSRRFQELMDNADEAFEKTYTYEASPVTHLPQSGVDDDVVDDPNTR